MSTPSNPLPETSFPPQGSAPAALALTRPLYWSVRRELWENRSIYIAPLAVAGVFLFGFLISMVGLPHKMRALAVNPTPRWHDAIAMPYHFAAGLLMVTQMLVGLFYCLDALYGERRDRSILFWKSLPVSDLTTVLSKAMIPLVILPLLTVVTTVITVLAMFLLSTSVVAASGLSVETLWTQISLGHFLMMVVYHLLTVHTLWHAPIYAWFLLVSGWARRAVFLWAVLPLLAIGVLEKIIFGSTHFALLVMYRLTGPESYALESHAHDSIVPMTAFSLWKFLGTPGLWFGLVAIAVFLVIAVRIRRYREPI